MSDTDDFIMSGLRPFCNLLPVAKSIRPRPGHRDWAIRFGMPNSVTQSFKMLNSSRAARCRQIWQNRGDKYLTNLAIVSVSVNFKLSV